MYNKLASMMDFEGGGLYFKGRMEDGKTFNYCIDSDVEFIDMPQGYIANQLVDILHNNDVRDFKEFKEKFYFNCFLDYIPYVQ